MKKILVVLSAVSGIIACIGDCILVYLFGKSSPGYDLLKQPMSILGSASSPFADQISGWWILQGVLLILFALGFIVIFQDRGKIFKLAGICIIIYGLGEGIATGAVPIETINNHLTVQGYIHDLLGGIGVGAIMILPFLLSVYYKKMTKKAMYYLSLTIGICGVMLFGMFTLAKILKPDIGIFSYAGAWQRLSSLNYYIYLISLSFQMLRATLKTD